MTEENATPTKRAKVTDFVSDLIDRSVIIARVPAVRAKAEKKDKEGNVIQEAVEPVKGIPQRVDTTALADLAAQNKIDGEKFRGAEPKDAGRARMSIGNMLRAAAKRRHGLYDLGGSWHDAPEGFADGEPTETPEGVKIPKAKAEETTEE